MAEDAPMTAKNEEYTAALISQSSSTQLLCVCVMYTTTSKDNKLLVMCLTWRRGNQAKHNSASLIKIKFIYFH